jgi:hypothetical protein
MSFHARLDVFFDLSTQWATLNGELDANANEALGGNRDIAHHAQVDNVVAKLGVNDRTQKVANGVGARHWAGSAWGGPLRKVGVCARHEPNVPLSFAHDHSYRYSSSQGQAIA